MRLFTPPRVWTVVLVAAVGVGVVTMLRVGPTATDIVLDKYQAVEAWAGDPYMTQGELVASYGLGEYGHPAPSPRSPGAIVLQSLTIAFDDGVLRWIAMLASVGGVAATFWFAGRIGRVDQRIMAAAFLAYVVWRFGRLIWWNVTDVATPLIVASWWQARRFRLAGLLLGVAAAVKVWPAIIVAALLSRSDSRRLGWWATGAAVVLTGLGLLIPSVSVAGSLEAMTAAGSHWGSAPTVAAVLAAGAVLAVGLSGGHHRRFAGAAAAGLVLSPIAWLDYWLVLLPVAALALRSSVDLLDKTRSNGRANNANSAMRDSAHAGEGAVGLDGSARNQLVVESASRLPPRTPPTH